MCAHVGSNMMSTSPPSTVVHRKLDSSTRPLSIRTRTLVQVLSLASTAAFFDSAVHAWALWRCAPGPAPAVAAVGPCASSVGGRAPKVPVARGQRRWPLRWGRARKISPARSSRRQLRVLRAGDLARAGGRAQHCDGGNGEGGGTVGWKLDGAYLL